MCPFSKIAKNENHSTLQCTHTVMKKMLSIKGTIKIIIKILFRIPWVACAGHSGWHSSGHPAQVRPDTLSGIKKT